MAQTIDALIEESNRDFEEFIDRLAAMDPDEWPIDYKTLPLDELFVDHEYQRGLTAIADKIAKRTNPFLLNVLVVSERNGNGRRKARYAIVDGQNRWEGMRRRGMKRGPCLVLQGLTPEQEADLFAKFQRDRKNVKPFDRFRAQVKAGDRRANAIKHIVEAEGYEFNLDPYGKRAMKAIVALERMYDRDPARLRLTLSLIRRTWPDNPFATSERLLKGMFRFLEDQKDDVDEDRFVERLSRTMPSDLSRRAAQLQEARGMSGNAPSYMAETLETEYRRRRRS